MERLTKRDKDGNAYWNGKNGVSYSDIKGNIYGNAITRLAEYEDAEEQGLIIRLPVAEGTPVYMIAEDCGGDTLDCRRGECEGCGYHYSFVEENAFDAYMRDDIGKTIFLTKEEAEQALKQMGE